MNSDLHGFYTGVLEEEIPETEESIEIDSDDE